ncbi:glycosyltransferase family 4 protein [Mucilaginibacter terrenus]|uniref:Glycosyltransferase family 4 protein n=1 Tax=Mucilaginibacter terrenus TaxID=2482727 RepID=A0A3E2NMR0_9SPHI|nr:glycosyltransferase [Mucilaginibacter terrenus]RFZ82285.1 glycosyltransferase family 4 protein [Mucilaginibacter terrenus]
MNILLINNTRIPATKYGGTERMVWWLGRELVRLGHKVTYLVGAGSLCSFAKVLTYNPAADINSQIPDDVDVVHFQFQVQGFTKKPYIVTVNDNPGGHPLDRNSVFVSGNHAARHGATAFVYNGLDSADYPIPDLKGKRNYFHFLAKAAWRVKNVKGAIDVATISKNKLVVLGGTRLNIKMGFRFTPNLNVSFKGMVDDQQKAALMNNSKGLIYPVRWNEPFGIAITESLYFGCPVFGTPYGSLPELVPSDVGFLSNSKHELAEAMKNADSYNRQRCHQYVMDNFNITKMANEYLKLYEAVAHGATINKNNPVLQEQNPPKFLPWVD